MSDEPTLHANSEDSVSDSEDEAHIQQAEQTASAASSSSSSNDAHDSDEDDQEGPEWQGWDEEDTVCATCLFCRHQATSSSSIFAHVKEIHNFDFSQFRTKQRLDEYDCIRLINFIRAQTATGTSLEDTLALVNQGEWRSKDEYLKPFLEDDPLLCDVEDDEEDDDDEREHKQRSSQDPKDALIEQLQKQIAASNERIQEMQLAMQRMVDAGEEKSKAAAPEESKETKVNQHDEGYFEAYSSRNIHETMLRDKTRTLAYRDFIHQNKELFQGKVVLDVGCGTGILCMFAAQAGAKQVIGVDAADIIDKARVIVKQNGFEHVISLVKSKVEDAQLPVDKVDIIVSEWMGYFLLYESMLPSVLFARDKWLVSDGLVLPNKAAMFLAGAQLERKHTQEAFWKDVYGFDMSTLLEEKERFVTCDVDEVPASKLCTDTVAIKHLDIATCRSEDLEFLNTFELQIRQDSTLDAFVVWFDVTFQHKGEATVLTTSPTSSAVALTHWFQTVFYVHEPLRVAQGAVVEGSIHAKRGLEYNRGYGVEITYGIKGDPSNRRWVQSFTV